MSHGRPQRVGRVCTRTRARRSRCQSCGAERPAWLPGFNEPNGAMWLDHLAQQHADQVGASLDRMPTDDDHDRVVVEAYEVVED
jgi:hypothetical protein